MAKTSGGIRSVASRKKRDGFTILYEKNRRSQLYTAKG